MLGFLEFSILFISLNIIADLIHYKVRVVHGIDFLFFAPWLAGALYGLQQGIILAGILLALHVVFNIDIALYQVASFPSLAVAIFLGNNMGVRGFWVSLAAYLGVSSVIVLVLRGFGGRFLSFLLAALIFNFILLFTIPYLV